MRRRARARFAGLAALVLGCPGYATAQGNAHALPFSGPSARRPPRAAPDPDEASGKPRGWISSRLALGRSEALLASSDQGERERALERLADAGDASSLDRLVHLASANAAGVAAARQKLATLRALARHARAPQVRSTLARALDETPPGPVATSIRDVAAFALAAAGDDESVAALAATLARGGPPAEAAARALIAHPPRTITAFGGPSAPMSPRAAEVLGDLGDARAIPALRRALEAPADAPDGAAPPPALIAAATLALAKLGDARALSSARKLASSSDDATRRIGISALVLAHAPEASSSIADALGDDARRSDALEWAARAPTPALAPRLAEIARAGGEPGGRAIAVLGRIGDDASVATLAALVGDAERGDGATFALALVRGRAARDAISVALASTHPATRRRALRAATLRAFALDDEPGRTGTAIASLASSSDASDRAVAAVAALVTARADAGALVASDDAAVVRAVARAAPALGHDALAACGARLATGLDPTTRAALGVALVDLEIAARFSTPTLRAWVDEGGALAPLAARALAARDDDGDRARIDAWLGGPDLVVRAHVALGLGASARATASARIAAAFDVETYPHVRRAFARALASRDEPPARRARERIALLEPDAATRRLAAAATAKEGPGRGAAPAWLRIARDDAGADASVVVGRLVRADALALPLVADPDGVALVLALPDGDAALDLAIAPREDDAPRR